MAGENQPDGTQQEVPPPDKIPGAPRTPLELGKTGWRDLLKRSAKEFKSDRCPMTAGSLAYYWFLSLFPALIALLGLARPDPNRRIDSESTGQGPLPCAAPRSVGGVQ